MNESLSSASERVIQFTTLLLIFLFPVFFLTNTPNFFETNKLLLLLIVAGVNLGAWALHTIAKKELQLTITPFTFPLLGVGLAFLLSAFFAAPNPTEALLGRGTLLPALALVVFTGVNTIHSRRFANRAIYALIGSGVVLSFISVLQSLGFGLSSLLNSVFNTNLPDTLSFTPAGSPVALITYLAPVVILTLFLAFARKDSLEKVVLFLLSAVMTAGLVLLVLYSFPGKDTAPVFLPPQYGYAVALETLKNTDTALLGYGPESFVNAYNRVRPAALNLTDYWNIRFTSSSNELFQVITTTGFVGLLAWAALALVVLRVARRSTSSTVTNIIKVVTLGTMFLLLLVPGTYLHLFTFFVLIMIWSILLKLNNDPRVSEFNFNLNSISLVRADQGENRESPLAILPYLVGVPVLLLTVGLFYFTLKAYSAETTFKQALDAAADNDGVATYNYQQEAIKQNPYVSRYRRAYSATNLALANTLSAKEDLSDQEKADVTQLIQQSIREAKAAVTLDQQNAANWENLTFVYRSLINVAQNADQWTIASLAQAIQNDPVNPRLRLELGGIYYALGQYDQAIRLYQQSAELKPDWANAYYNLASAHRQKNELNQAYEYLRRVMTLVGQDTADYAKAQEELRELADQLNLQDQDDTGEPQGELNTPSPIPTRNPDAQVDLEDSEGPGNLNNPTPTATPRPTNTPAPDND